MPNSQSNRRQFMRLMGAGVAAGALAACGSAPAEAKSYPYSLSEKEWRGKLSKAQYRILREAGTERKFTSPLNGEKRVGTYHCAACGQALYSSQTKYESGTGWPAFWEPIPGAIGTSTDYKIGIPRTEAHCSNCGSHLGHIFGDGPKPTGKRHCINGLALEFRPA